MIQKIEHSDLELLCTIISDAIRSSVIVTDAEAKVLIEEVKQSLITWYNSGADGFSATYCMDNEIAGFIVVKEYWNVSHLFVSPRYQKQGIGKALVSQAINSCKEKSPKKKMLLNSPTSAVDFYTAIGFIRNGVERDLPGGCIQFE